MLSEPASHSDHPQIVFSSITALSEDQQVLYQDLAYGVLVFASWQSIQGYCDDIALKEGLMEAEGFVSLGWSGHRSKSASLFSSLSSSSLSSPLSSDEKYARSPGVSPAKSDLVVSNETTGSVPWTKVT